MEIFWTIFGTVISGVVVFVVSQLIMEFLIKPHLEYKKLKNKILVAVTYYSDVLTNPYIIDKDNYESDVQNLTESKWMTAAREMRKLGSEMAAYNKKHSKDIHKNLIGLSNGVWQYKDSQEQLGMQNKKMIDEIKEWLK
jgi:hypothetical protein